MKRLIERAIPVVAGFVLVAIITLGSIIRLAIFQPPDGVTRFFTGDQGAVKLLAG